MRIFDYLKQSQEDVAPVKEGESTPISEDEAGTYYLVRGLVRRAIVFVVLLLVFGTINACMVVTNPDEFTVVMQFGEIQKVNSTSGVSFKLPFIQSVRTVPNNLQFYDIPISEVITQDKKTMVTDCFVLWRVTDPVLFLRTLSGNVSTAEARISVVAYTSMKSVISRMPQSDIISGRDVLATQIHNNVGTNLEPYGVVMTGFETKHIDLPDDNKEAVFNRMVSERRNIAATYSAEGQEQASIIRNETDAKISIMLSEANADAALVIAEGETEYMQLMADAYNTPERSDFYVFVRALDAAKASMQGGNTTLILTPDSPIAKIFY